MGCCISTTATTPAPPAAAAQALSTRPTQPLKPKATWRSPRPRSAATYARRRQEFWETRVTGRAEVWQALRAAGECIRGGQLELAQGIVDAAGLTVPTGDFFDGVYDDLGCRYELPEYAFADPENVVVESREAAAVVVGLPPRKEVVVVEGGGVVTVRLAEGSDVAVCFLPGETVASVAAKVLAGIDGKKKQGAEVKVTLMYLGRILDENRTLHQQGWKKGDVVNALVRARR